MADFKIVTRSEEFIMVNKKSKEEELAKLKATLRTIAEDIVHKDKEYEQWKNEQLDKRRQLYAERIREVQDILDKING